MLDRASIIDTLFLERVKQGDFPTPRSAITLAESGLSKKTALDLFDTQIKSRQLDLIARQLKEKGLAYYTIGSSGHEGNAVFGYVFKNSDMAFLHYRSAAFFLQRAKQFPGCDGVEDVLLSFVAAARDPIAGGRHKVLGSVPLNIPPQTSTIASHLPKALGMAFSIRRAKELGIEAKLPSDSVIICSFGDASINHSVTQGTLNACSWIAQNAYPLPLVLICEDNGIGISVPTPENWVEETIKNRPFIHYLACDGLNLADCFMQAKLAEKIARQRKQVVFLHMRCVRLLGHAGSDIETQYHSLKEIEETEANDPLLHTAGLLYRAGWMTLDSIQHLYEDNQELIQAKAIEVAYSEQLNSATAIMSALVPKVIEVHRYPLPSEAIRKITFADSFPQLAIKRNLSHHINFALTDLMLQYPQMVIFGEDVGKKGGVYRVTADLQARFGQRRVFDTLLDETTILGTAIGMAHNGFLPVPEIQFLAYLHNAEDQLRGEASTLSFFSNGQYKNPMVIRIAALAYQKGFGGHFHNDNSIAVLRDIPGLIVACPSNGPDAARLLRTSMELAQNEGRIVVFLEPIALYMTKDLHETGDNQWLFEYPSLEEKIRFGEVSTFGKGETVIITYANGYYLSRQAEKILREKYKTSIKIIDLHWLCPLPKEAILREIAGAKNILIVDEGRKSASISEGVMTLLIEEASPQLNIKRVVGEDCFIPLGNAWQYLLPSKETIIIAALSFESSNKENENGRFTIS
ncbi:2-oxoisovalerate dehydrogenase, E1 component, alpha and beta fusion (plasmid) [Legionella adelaidensis]|uniref:3-methyl-2-oxobutanoate dehydrogenase (2-methylpropanoyl-transferring) n=1 Tax=Legionella adelaidensis TaxID=45056 RepID=A0A0W0R5Q5_9GAMM|nr:thiamine pyrophosphate-dependent enzyme [Legionella adelaidensis]KTC66403.1 2-oxoisovalerate dehydrogenase, E1 component, alpha and beta fusion [Legionella adelaidensis]VEH85001.1 2-oxoisovalerate dehydrogenase, E1 component, alpha and beta fusion [Legionella adelaidensis]